METVEKICGWASKGGIAKQNTEALKESENFPFDTIIMDTCNFTSAETHRMYSTVNPNVNCGL